MERYGRSQAFPELGGPSRRLNLETGELEERTFEGEDRDIVRGRRNNLGQAERSHLLAELAVTRRLLAAAIRAAALLADGVATDHLRGQLVDDPRIDPDAACAVADFLDGRRT